MADFIDVKFGFCPLVLMFYGRILNRKINHLQERSLQTDIDAAQVLFINCFEKTILSLLITEVFKVWRSGIRGYLGHFPAQTPQK